MKIITSLLLVLLLSEGVANEYKGYQRKILTIHIENLNAEALYYESVVEGSRPLLVYLHGAGGGKKPIGNKGSEMANGFSQQGLVCDVVHPYSRSGWAVKSLDRFIDDMIKRFSIDTNRLYVAGFSMGGAGTWKYGFEGKHAIAAFVPIASGASKTGKVHEVWGLEEMKDKPIWMFHGEEDRVVPFENAHETAALMEQLNPNFKFTAYPNVEHGSYRPVLAECELYPWILQHSIK